MKKKSKKSIAIDALRKISNPIAWMQVNQKPGTQINEMMLIELNNSPAYLKQIAVDALRELGENI